MPRALLAIVAGLAIIFGCLSLAQKDANTGLEGTITIAPFRPGPTRIDQPEAAPLANVAFVVQNESGTVAVFNTDGEGRFHLSLPPGHYTINRKDPTSRIGHFGPFEVDVVAGQMAKVEWRCDSGMR